MKEVWLKKIVEGKSGSQREDTVENLIPTYGEVPELTENVKEVLRLPIKHKRYDRVTSVGIRFEKELSNCKTRWGRTTLGNLEEQAEDKKERDGKGLPSESEYLSSLVEENNAREMYDPKNKTFNVSKLKATDMRDNPRLHMPKPRPQKEEVMIEAKGEMYSNIDNYLEEVSCSTRKSHDDICGNGNARCYMTLMLNDDANAQNNNYSCEVLRSTQKMPVLDTLLWVGRECTDEGILDDLVESPKLKPDRDKVLTTHNLILYKFYKKPMADKTPNRQTNALPENVKVTTVSNEVIRRTKCTSLRLPPRLVEDTLMEYTDELQKGGYPIQWCAKVLDSSTRCFVRMWEKEKTGKGVINRPDGHSSLRKRAEKLVGKSTWFKDQPYREENDYEKSKTKTNPQKVKMMTRAETEGIMFIPLTPQSKLKKELQALEDSVMMYSTVGRTNFIERAGTSLSHEVCNRTPWKT